MIVINQGKHRSHAPVHPDQRPDFFFIRFRIHEITFPLEAERNEKPAVRSVFPELAVHRGVQYFRKLGGSWLLPVCIRILDTSGGANCARDRVSAHTSTASERRQGKPSPYKSLPNGSLVTGRFPYKFPHELLRTFQPSPDSVSSGGRTARVLARNRWPSTVFLALCILGWIS